MLPPFQDNTDTQARPLGGQAAYTINFASGAVGSPSTPSHPFPDLSLRIHILGISGVFMAGIALLARELGHEVSGSDRESRPPMGTMLARAGIEVRVPHRGARLSPDPDLPPDLVIIGNALSRGNEEVEAALGRGLPYISGPQWLAEQVLRSRRVLAVAGTHGKTTTAALCVHLLQKAGLEPGFLIGGQPLNSQLSARLGQEWFVIEADEYDTAFFDKRPKFLHYRPEVAVINNIEFDHADIYQDLAAIEQQFHYLLRSIPPQGLALVAAGDPSIENALNQGHWCRLERIGGSATSKGRRGWHLEAGSDDWSRFTLVAPNGERGEVQWQLLGRHNAENALRAVAAVCSLDLGPEGQTETLKPGPCAEAASSFGGVARRLQKLGQKKGLVIYDDFAHHPSALAATLSALRQHHGDRVQLIAVPEMASSSMRAGIHGQRLASSFSEADQILFWRPPKLEFLDAVASEIGPRAQLLPSIEALEEALEQACSASLDQGCCVVFLSNGSFAGLPHRFAERLQG